MKNQYVIPSLKDWEIFCGVKKKLGLHFYEDGNEFEGNSKYDKHEFSNFEIGLLLRLSSYFTEGNPVVLEGLYNIEDLLPVIINQELPPKENGLFLSDGITSRTYLNRIRLLSNRVHPNSSFIESNSISNWEKKYKALYVLDEFFKKRKKSKKEKRTKAEFAHRLTGAGVVALELLLNKPTLISEESGYFNNTFFLNFELLKKGFSEQWKRSFFESNNLACKDFHIDTFKEIKEILGSDEEIFWRMSSEITLLIGQAYVIMEQIEVSERNSKILKMLHYKNKESKNLCDVLFNPHEIKLMFMKKILNDFILNELKKSGIKIEDVIANKPPDFVGYWYETRLMKLIPFPNILYIDYLNGNILDENLFFQKERECSLACVIALLHIFDRNIVNSRGDFELMHEKLLHSINTSEIKNKENRSLEVLKSLLFANDIKNPKIVGFDSVCHNAIGVYLLKIGWHLYPDLTNERKYKNIYDTVEDEHFVIVEFRSKDTVVCWEPSFSGDNHSPLFEVSIEKLKIANSKLLSKEFKNKLIYIDKLQKF